MNTEKFDLIEVLSLKRSGHHAFIKWICKNICGLEPNFGFKLEFLSDSGVWVWNDVNRYNKLGVDLYNKAINNNTPNTLIVNYEDETVDYTFFHKTKKYHGPKNYNENSQILKSKRVYIIRDFYNCITSRIKHEENYLHTLNDFGEKYIRLWKEYAINYLRNDNSIKFEDLLTNRKESNRFLTLNFGITEYCDFNNISKTKSSFNNGDYLNRFDINIIPEETKNLIRKDNELHYLIGALGYEYKEI